MGSSSMWSYRKKRDPPTGPGVVDFFRREVGDLTPRAFTNLANASEDLVSRLKIHSKLSKHRGCVNTISFNASGNALLSGSDDRMIMLWDWDMGTRKLAFHSGHRNNIFQAKFMPFTDDRRIVTCAADGEVRQAHIADGGRVDVKLLGSHEGRVHKIAIEPGSPHVFYSCGEDGRVLRFDLRKERAMQLFTCKSLQEYPSKGNPIRLNAIAVDPMNHNFFAVSGTDDLVRLYDIRRYKVRGRASSRDSPSKLFCPSSILHNTTPGITGLAFSDSSELLASYSNENIYLFTKDQGLELDQLASFLRSSDNAGSVVGEGTHEESDVKFCVDHDITIEPKEYTGHHNSETMKGVGFYGPNCEYVISGSDCGRIFIWRKKDGTILRAMEGDKYIINCVEPHPHAPVLASSGIENDIKMWLPNAEDRSPPIDPDEVGRRPQNSNSFYFYELMDGEIYDTEYEDDDDDDDDDDGDDYDDDDDDNGDDDDDDDDDGDDDNDVDVSYDDGSDSHDDNSSVASSDLVSGDECMDGHLSDHYLASGNADDAL